MRNLGTMTANYFVLEAWLLGGMKSKRLIKQVQSNLRSPSHVEHMNQSDETNLYCARHGVAQW